MRRTGATRDTSRREQDSTSQRESGSAERTAPEEPLAALHRAGGNQAVQSLAGRERVDRAASEGVGGVSDGGEPLLRGPTADLCPRCISRYRAGKSLDCEECESALAAESGEQAIEVSTDGPAVQSKLAVSDPDDRYEREAERVAEAVMREDAGANAERGGERAPEAVQRMCSACQERSRRGKPLNCEECEAELQRATDSSGGEVDGDVAGQVRAARRGGRPLPEQTRSYLESRMGRDFGDVRVHTGTQADEAARSLNARAFTLGSDVVFRAGEYRPHTRSGKRLLAHELTHVVQQGGISRLQGTIHRQGESMTPGLTSCSADQASHLEAAHNEAVELAGNAAETFASLVRAAHASNDLEKFGHRVHAKDSRLAANLTGSFRLPVPSRAGDLSPADEDYSTERNLDAVTDALGHIHDIYDATHDGFVNGEFNYECQSWGAYVPRLGCDSDTNAFVKEVPLGETGWGNVFICPIADWSDETEMAKTLIHELTHYFGPTDDYEPGTNRLMNAYTYGMTVENFQDPPSF